MLPAAPGNVPPRDYALMMEILQQMMLEAARDGQPPSGIKPFKVPSAEPNGMFTAASSAKVGSGKVPSTVVAQPSNTQQTVVDTSVSAQETIAPSLLGTWQRKNNIVTCTLQFKPDYLCIDIESHSEEIGIVKISINGEYALLKDQRTVICYITSIDMNTRHFAGVNKNNLVLLSRLNQLLVETAVAIKIAIYDETLVVTSIRLPLQHDPQDLIGYMQLFTGRYERLATPATNRK